MRILLIDDIPVLRSSIESKIRLDFSFIEDFVSVQYSDIRSLNTKVEFDLIIIGFSLSPLEEIKYLSSSINSVCYKETRILCYDTKFDPKRILFLLSKICAVFSGYFIMNEPVEEFSKCLNALKNGRRFISSSASDWLFDNWNTKQRRTEISTLTFAEKEVADLLIKGYSTSEIATERNSKPSTISTIKRNIFRKVGADNVISLKEEMTRVQI